MAPHHLHFAAPRRFTVAVLGFSTFERAAQMASFTLSAGTAVSFQPVDDLALADFAVVDMEDAVAVDQVIGAGRVQEAIFVGNGAPDAAMSWLHRPLDGRRLLRTLTAMVEDDDEEITTSWASSFGPLAVADVERGESRATNPSRTGSCVAIGERY